jgi:hypothetical protein
MHIEEAQSVYVCVCLCKGLSGPIIFRGTLIECPLFSFNTFHEPQLRYLDFPIEIECTYTSSCSDRIISLTTDYHNHDFRFYLFAHLYICFVCPSAFLSQFVGLINDKINGSWLECMPNSLLTLTFSPCKKAKINRFSSIKNFQFFLSLNSTNSPNRSSGINGSSRYRPQTQWRSFQLDSVMSEMIQ